MAKLRFSNVVDEERLKRVFDYLKVAKEREGVGLDEETMRGLVGGRAETAFLDLRAPEYRDLSYEDLRERLKAQGLLDTWDFASWIDALNGAALEYESLEIDESAGTLVFHQLSWPSGGIEATQELIKLFGGVIDECDAD